jgi:hypothetical protein
MRARLAWRLRAKRIGNQAPVFRLKRHDAARGNTVRVAASSIEREIEIIAVSLSKLGCPLILCGVSLLSGSVNEIFVESIDA